MWVYIDAEVIGRKKFYFEEKENRLLLREKHLHYRVGKFTDRRCLTKSFYLRIWEVEVLLGCGLMKWQNLLLYDIRLYVHTWIWRYNSPRRSWRWETETKDLIQNERPCQIVAAGCPEDKLSKEKFTLSTMTKQL